MDRGSRKMKILVLCVMLRELLAEMPERILSIDRWQEDLAEPEILLERAELSENSRSFDGEKFPLHLEGLTEQVKRREQLSLQPRILARTPCPCETHYEIRDLGEGHYPRYLTASRCKPKTCQTKFHSCRLLHYMVHVLRQREVNGLPEDRYADDGALPESPLPESLRHKWQLKPMSIGVACVQTPENRRN